MHRLKFVSVAAVAALVLAGSAFGYRVVRVGASANKKTILLHPSDRLVVTLAGNASAGYSWKLQHVDPSIVTLVSRKYVPQSSTQKVGAAGRYIFRFRAKALGSTTLRIGYAHSGSKASFAFTLKLVVKSPVPRV